MEDLQPKALAKEAQEDKSRWKHWLSKFVGQEPTRPSFPTQWEVDRMLWQGYGTSLGGQLFSSPQFGSTLGTITSNGTWPFGGR